MNSELTTTLRQLIHDRVTAALGTLHQGAPFVSMVPFAVAKDGWFILHVSGLASHTRDMLYNPNVSLLIAESETSGKMPQALARVTVQGTAAVLDRETRDHAAARDVYLSRFPDAAPLFEFSDFRIVIVTPLLVRIIAGFGQAGSMTAAEFVGAVSAGV